MAVTHRLLIAINAHDAVAVAACVSDDYESAQPAHPARAFRGRAQVFENWSEVFAGVPDIRARLVTFAVSGDVEFGEWEWSGVHADGDAFEMRGATVFGVENDLIQWGRLYMEQVDADALGIEDMVRETYRPPE
jgi:ketosteroid isomerase-like protein